MCALPLATFDAIHLSFVHDDHVDLRGRRKGDSPEPIMMMLYVYIYDEEEGCEQYRPSLPSIAESTPKHT